MWVFIVSGEWKVASEVTGEGCCYWNVEREKQQVQYTFNITLIRVRVTTLAGVKQ